MLMGAVSVTGSLTHSIKALLTLDIVEVLNLAAAFLLHIPMHCRGVL